MSEKYEQAKYRVIQACYFLTGALCLSIKGGYSYAPAVLLLFSLPLVFNFKTYSTLNRNSKIVLTSMLLYVLVHAISILLDGGQVREFDRPSRALLGMALLILCLRYPPRFLWLMTGVGVGAIGAGVNAIVDVYVHGALRAFHLMSAIQGGNISMTLGLFSLCGVVWAIKKPDYRYAFFFTVAAILGILGNILSGTRGAWLLLPVILFVIYRVYRGWFSKGLKLGLAVSICLLVVLLVTTQSSIAQRFQEAPQMISDYFSKGDKTTSAGIRFDLWKGALDSFARKPLFGWGNNGVRVYQEQQYKDGVIAQSTYNLNYNAHNQFFDEMAKRGLVGLSVLLSLFLCPLYIYNKQLNRSNGSESRTLAACGIVLVLSTMGYCLTQAFLNQNSGIVFYCVFTAYFLSSNPLHDF